MVNLTEISKPTVDAGYVRKSKTAKRTHKTDHLASTDAALVVSAESTRKLAREQRKRETSQQKMPLMDDSEPKEKSTSPRQTDSKPPHIDFRA